MKDDCFRVLCWFLSDINMNQPQLQCFLTAYIIKSKCVLRTPLQSSPILPLWVVPPTILLSLSVIHNHSYSFVLLHLSSLSQAGPCSWKAFSWPLRNPAPPSMFSSNVSSLVSLPFPPWDNDSLQDSQSKPPISMTFSDSTAINWVCVSPLIIMPVSWGQESGTPHCIE